MRMLGEMAVLEPDTGSFSTMPVKPLARGQALPLVGYIGGFGYLRFR